MQVGDKVEIGFPESALVKGAAYMYLFPLIGLLFGSLLSNLVYHSMGGEGELAAIVGGGLGFIGSLMWLKRRFSNHTPTGSQQVSLIRHLGGAIQIHQP
jgi:sigma-E factor negative regulatory protein RseC